MNGEAHLEDWCELGDPDSPSGLTTTPVLWCWTHGDATIYRSPKNENDWYCRTWNSYNGSCDISARRMEAR